MPESGPLNSTTGPAIVINIRAWMVVVSLKPKRTKPGHPKSTKRHLEQSSGKVSEVFYSECQKSIGRSKGKPPEEDKSGFKIMSMSKRT